MAELADALDLGSSGFPQVLLSAPDSKTPRIVRFEVFFVRFIPKRIRNLILY